VAVLCAGRLQQVGSPQALYTEPSTRFVATFIGRSSVLPGRWVAPGGVRLEAGPTWRAIGDGLADGAEVDLVVRPEALALAFSSSPQALSGEIAGRRFAGRDTSFEVALDGGGSVEAAGPPGVASAGQKVFVAPDPAGPAPRAYPRQP
jgi:ABC-type Fe3+/spermidine/putrescine transport system ATPase subunit